MEFTCHPSKKDFALMQTTKAYLLHLAELQKEKQSYFQFKYRSKHARTHTKTYFVQSFL
jgi:hypothetical protein